MANPNFVNAVHPKDYSKRGIIANPFTCPKCKTVYPQSDPIAECRFCNWKNKEYIPILNDDVLINNHHRS